MSDMVSVQRANVVLRIKESEAERYLAKGYNILDEDGKVARKAIPGTLGELQVAYAEHIKEIDELKAEIEAYKAEIEALKAKPESSPKKASKKKSEKTEVKPEEVAE